MSAEAIAVSAHGAHAIPKPTLASSALRAGCGVDGDALAGVTVTHRSRAARTPLAPV